MTTPPLDLTPLRAEVREALKLDKRVRVSPDTLLALLDRVEPLESYVTHLLASRDGAVSREKAANRRAEAAEAKVHGVRAAVEGPHPANSGLDSFTLAHVAAALDGGA